MPFVCPRCRNAKGLWRDVTIVGWESVGDDLTPKTWDGRGEAHDVDWSNPAPAPTGRFGCGECQWTGRQDAMLRLGIDGKPLPDPIPGQETLV